MGISFFAKKPMKKIHSGHLLRGSTIIRAYQVAERMGAKLNPESGYEDDIVIYVKPPNSQCAPTAGRTTYIDVVDDHNALGWIKDRPDVRAIVISLHQYGLYKDAIGDRVEYIPQHHCNFERELRDATRPVLTVGTIGVPGGCYFPEDKKEELKRNGIDLITESHFMNRQDVLDFYKKIDIQYIGKRKGRAAKNPMRIMNAASFGIPSVAFTDPHYAEMDGAYMGVDSWEEMTDAIMILRNSPDLYKKYSERALGKIEEYHIDNIIKLYNKLT